MDQIYGASYLTIVAAAGTNSWAGLPGLRPGTRDIHQVTEMIAGMTLGSCQPWFVESMNSSKWSTRAWTLQEYFLSKRLFIFTPEQIYFQCHQALWLEDVHLEASKINATVGLAKTFTDFTPRNNNFYFKSPLIQYRDFDLYVSLVEDFTTRHLTYQSDILRAFNRIPTLIEKQWKTKFYNGIPTRYLESSMLFRTQKSTDRYRRRVGFPSWSWVGWEGSIHMYLRQTDVQSAVGLIGDCITADVLWFRPHLDPKEPLQILAEDNGTTEVLRDSSHSPDSQLSPVDIILAQTLPAGLKDHEQSQLLICHTSTAWIETEHMDYSSVASQSVQSDKKEHMVIAIDPSRIEIPTFHHKSFWVLPIETDERGISYRVANPRSLDVGKWQTYKPTNRMVYLG